MPRSASACKHRTKAGKLCRAAATESGFCFLHSKPGLAAEIGRAGGRKNRHVVPDELRPLPSVDTIEGVKQAVAQMIGDVYSKRLPPRTAAGLAPLINTMLRVLSAADLEQRVKQLEEQLSDLTSESVATDGVGEGD